MTPKILYRESFSLYITAATSVEIIVPPPLINVKRKTGGKRAVSEVANWFITNTATASANPQM